METTVMGNRFAGRLIKMLIVRRLDFMILLRD